MKIIIIAIIIVLVVVAIMARRRLKDNDSVKEISGFDGLRNITPITLNRQLSFTSDVVSYFKELRLNPGEDTPFIIDGIELAKRVKDLSNVSGPSLFLGVFKHDGSIVNYRLLCADSFDNQTKEVLTKATDGIVTLS